ncbi:MAG: LPS export ABC transporter periplasmic protein LptC [Proteobacteria bacterium]|nr:LPS export ABC transporter periplasmic protein LptC [Pseudomonadota bacterium]
MIILILLLCFLNTEPCKASSPLIITSDQLECQQDTARCIATGHAKAEQKDQKTSKTLTADQFIAQFKSDKKEQNQQQLDQLIAEGHVFVTIDDKERSTTIIVTADKAVFFQESNMVHLYDNIKIVQEENIITGSYGKINLTTGHYQLYSSSKEPQIKAVIYPKKAS